MTKTLKPLSVVFFSFLGFSLMFHASVQASDFSYIARPAVSAVMVPDSAIGVFTEAVNINVIVSRMDKKRLPTSIQVVVDGEVVELPVAEVEQDECGSVWIHAAGVSAGLQQTLTLKDSSSAYCIEPGVRHWEARLDVATSSGAALGHLEFSGNPSL